MRFGGVHVFEYSPREPTAAAALPHQVTASVKKQRSAALRQAAAHMKQAFLQGYVGRTVQVLFEARKDGFWQGHTANYMTVRAKGGQSNLLTDVTLTHIIKETLYGEVKA
jgi:tRNA A37 methylthiotransferase MiaB